jgi:predicted RNA binding protein YcfA (HicA-like mRNA interferase family)
MAEYGREVRNIFSKNGCIFIRHGKGSHDIWHSPITNRIIAVNGKVKDRHTANAILADAGIKEKL